MPRQTVPTLLLLLYSWVLVVAMIIVHHDPPSTIPARLCFVTVGPQLPVACIPDDASFGTPHRAFSPPTSTMLRNNLLTPVNSQPASVCTSRRAAVCCTAPPHLPSRRVLLTCFGRQSTYWVLCCNTDTGQAARASSTKLLEPECACACVWCLHLVAPPSVDLRSRKGREELGGVGQN